MKVKTHIKANNSPTCAELCAIGYTADWAYTCDGQDPGPDWQTKSVYYRHKHFQEIDDKHGKTTYIRKIFKLKKYNSMMQIH